MTLLCANNEPDCEGHPVRLGGSDLLLTVVRGAEARKECRSLRRVDLPRPVRVRLIELRAQNLENLGVEHARRHDGGSLTTCAKLTFPPADWST